MSEHVTLTLRAPLASPVETDAVAASAFATLSSAEITRLPVWEGREQRQLGELFSVSGERSASLRIEGDMASVDGLGAEMSGGTMIIAGSVGRYVGARMTGGEIRVEGDAGDGAGLEMRGGVLIIDGNAGDRTGGPRGGASKGMLGGEIIVRGSVGELAGWRMRRGLVVCAQAGARAGESMIAGTVVSIEPLPRESGRWNKRGSLVGLESGDAPLATYRYACTYRPPALRLLLRRLRARYTIAFPDDRLTGQYSRYAGDLAELGKGEILVWERP
ncbi:MAG TPA: formylmethanofuran dehydrogenase subunit C [Gemmatimonadaceae bacterium]|nr:formylmethanofuran dehydrogenase subunit C [Gemmatimonadaceae bacterium]